MRALAEHNTGNGSKVDGGKNGSKVDGGKDGVEGGAGDENGSKVDNRHRSGYHGDVAHDADSPDVAERAARAAWEAAGRRCAADLREIQVEVCCA